MQVSETLLGEKKSEVFVMSADGSSIRNLTNNPAFDECPRWSPDGKKIILGSSRGGTDYEIYVMNADGSDVRRS
jgi:Tol biopolymer transport system component